MQQTPMESVSMEGLMDKVFSEYGLVVVLLLIAIGWIARQWQKEVDKKDAVTALYHEDSKLNTIALNALTDWIKERK